MKKALIRYRTKPERTEENEQLIRAVFQELAAGHPAGLRYVAMHLGSGVFTHLVSIEELGADRGLTSLPAFQSFQKDIKGRCIELPSPTEVAIVGNYRMFGE